ncbi:pantoate-beta-alanine ligase [Tieghemiomyces parasiticus]|uniref:Pantoate-beta-alanine ligase n=1 Tax=Tieghemiomyces parasiticus TaxID=78921 RepID=A0A9W8DRD1_9FUNG|nr:pantoate-beta-alanine ligase [Tieghemiomyces parasiticus]
MSAVRLLTLGRLPTLAPRQYTGCTTGRGSRHFTTAHLCRMADANATPATRRAVLFGGTGFLGKYVARALIQDPNVTVRVVSSQRYPKRAPVWDEMGEQIEPFVSAEITEPDQVQWACRDADLVVNLVGIMHEKPPQFTFDNIQHRGAEHVARGAKDAGARLVHVSAIGADPRAEVPYARTKGLGERAVREVLPDAVVFRPSIVFGKEDDFFNRFARLAKFLPVMPVFDGGRTRFQPVYVKDLAAGIAKAAWDDAWKGATIEAGGPRIYTYREIIELTLEESDQRRNIVSVPWSVGKMQAWLLEKLPVNLFTITTDQVKLLQHDNVVDKDAKTLRSLGVHLTPAESVLHTWMYPKP